MINKNQLLKLKIETLLNSKDKDRKLKDRIEAKIKELDFNFEKNCINKLIIYFDRADMEEVAISNRSLIGSVKDTDALVKKIARVIVDKTSRPDLLWHAK